MADTVKEITNCEEVQAAIAAKPESTAEKQHIISKAVEYGCVDNIPDDWAVEVHEND